MESIIAIGKKSVANVSSLGGADRVGWDGLAIKLVESWGLCLWIAIG